MFELLRARILRDPFLLIWAMLTATWCAWVSCALRRSRGGGSRRSTGSEGRLSTPLLFSNATFCSCRTLFSSLSLHSSAFIALFTAARTASWVLRARSPSPENSARVASVVREVQDLDLCLDLHRINGGTGVCVCLQGKQF